MNNKENKHSEYRHVPLVRLNTVREKELMYCGEKMTTPEEAAGFVRRFIGDTDREYLVVCCTDMGMQPVSVEIAAIGTVGECLVEPREVFKHAVLSNSAHILMFHTHPSGSHEPSEADCAVTERIKKAGELLGIPLMDHIILGESDIYSFRREGKL